MELQDRIDNCILETKRLFIGVEKDETIYNVALKRCGF